MLDDKPFADVRSRRFEEGQRFSGFGGHTVRRAYPSSTPSGMDLKRSPTDVCTMAHAYLDAGKEYGAEKTCTLAVPYLMSAFELEGLDTAHSLQRANAWESVPATLAEHSVGMPAVHKQRDGSVAMSYKLEAQGALLPDKAVAEAENRLATHIYRIHRRRAKLEVVVPTEPPDNLPTASRLLKATMHCAASQVPQTACVRVNEPSAYWDVARARGKPLEVDLGATCLISAVSTQGRHPATRRYPRVWKEDNGIEHVEDAENRPAPEAGGKYKGPWWRVRQSEGWGTGSRHLGRSEKHYHSGDHAYHCPSWVSRYELLWRVDGGRQWHSLGIFDGNSDETTEVAHAFTAVRGGLRARYLRVQPLDSVGGGGLRLGVYGEGASSDSKGAGACRAVGTEARDDELSGGLISYTLTTPRARPAGQAPNSQPLAPDGQGCSGCRCSYCRPDRRPSANRQRRRLQAIHEFSSACVVDEEMLQETRSFPRGDDASSDGMLYRADGSAVPRATVFAGCTVDCLQGTREISRLHDAEQLELAMAMSLSLAEHEANRGQQVRADSTHTAGPESTDYGSTSTERVSERVGDGEYTSERMSEAAASEEWSLCSVEDADDDEWQSV